jgi:hypothetical protein
MKIAIVAGILTLVTVLFTSNISADGWHPSEEFRNLFGPYQKAVIYWSGYVKIIYSSSDVKVDNLNEIIENEINQSKTYLEPFVLSGIIVLSMISIAVISRKIIV